MTVPSWLPLTLLVGLGSLTLLMIGAAVLNRPSGAHRYPWWLRGVAFLFGPVMALFFCVMGIVEPPKDRDAPIFLGFTSGFVLVFYPVVWELLRFGYAVTPEGIDAVSPWRGRWRIGWADVDALTFDGGWFRIQSRKRGGFAVPLLASGLAGLLEEAEKHLTPDQLAGAIRGYTAVGRKFPYVGSPARALRR